MVLTQDENGDSIENCSDIGQQPHDHSQLRDKQQRNMTELQPDSGNRRGKKKTT